MDLELRVKIPDRSCPGVIVDPPEERLIFRRQHLLKPRSSFSRPSFNLGFVDGSSHRRRVSSLMAVDSFEGAYQYGHPKTAQTSISPLVERNPFSFNSSIARHRH